MHQRQTVGVFVQHIRHVSVAVTRQCDMIVFLRFERHALEVVGLVFRLELERTVSIHAQGQALEFDDCTLLLVDRVDP